MRIQMVFLICLSLAALTLGLIAAAGGGAALDRPPSAGFPYETAGRPSGVGVQCAHPRRLRLLRFEDGSAQVKCARRVLVRVSVPQR